MKKLKDMSDEEIEKLYKSKLYKDAKKKANDCFTLYKYTKRKFPDENPYEMSSKELHYHIAYYELALQLLNKYINRREKNEKDSE